VLGDQKSVSENSEICAWNFDNVSSLMWHQSLYDYSSFRYFFTCTQLNTADHVILKP